ncbi:PQQ-binding-like beta-propeller repeat protein [Halorussus aquaticus]|uniref:PQQ-binding-like beta-propeller repeat protein n=1 Tax=Halorussus aquaticus TaxID=2953748 RepID=A0ABD5Q0T2_9EURY|nr:PQQ-binding-like beta-propeller repeat protein [Halorussus aquaticus]
MKTPSISRRALLGATGVGAVATLGLSARKRGPDSISTRERSPGWPLLHHDTRNTGYNPHATGPESDPDVRWRVERFDPEGRFRGYLNFPTPVVSGDTVFVGGRSLSALRVGDGRERWSVEGGDGETFHGTAFADDTVFATTQYPETSGVTAVTSAGERRWRKTGLHRIQTPLVAGIAVYVPGDDRLVALDRSSGAERWTAETGSRPTGHPAVTDDALYTAEGWDGLAARDRRNAFYEIPLQTPPRVRWRYDPDERAYPAPAVGDRGRVFVPETEEWYPNRDEGPGKLAAFDPDGSRRWTESGGTFGTSPVVADGTVFYKCGTNTETKDMGEYVESHSDARITAHDPADGTARWTRTVESFGDWQIAPVSDGHRLYVPLHDDVDERSALVALNVETGTTEWRRTLESPAYHLALAGGTLFVSTEAGTVFALE